MEPVRIAPPPLTTAATAAAAAAAGAATEPGGLAEGGGMISLKAIWRGDVALITVGGARLGDTLGDVG